MNAEEVCKMIDAITEGRPYAFTGEGFTLDVKPELVTFFAEVGGSSVGNPRTAREIAGALIAWANRKEKVSVSQTLEAMGYDPVATQQVAAYDANSPESNNDPASHPIDCTCIFCVPGA